MTEIEGQETDAWVRDLLINALTVSAGAVDAISFLALGVFTAFMTGNIVFLGLRVAGADGPGATAVLVSLAAFGIGAYISTRIAKRSDVAGVWSNRVTAALGVSLIAQAVFLVVWLASDGRPSIDVANVLVGLWGLAMGMQSGAVRALRIEGVLTTAATATIVFLADDLTSQSATKTDRRRFAGALVSLFAGATAGGLLLIHARIYAPMLPFVITFATVATALIVLRE